MKWLTEQMIVQQLNAASKKKNTTQDVDGSVFMPCDLVENVAEVEHDELHPESAPAYCAPKVHVPGCVMIIIFALLILWVWTSHSIYRSV